MSQHQHPDLSHLWMPFTANQQFKKDPRLLVGAKGMYYTAAGGEQILDATAGLWCVNAGHGREEISTAIAQQTQTLDYAPSFQIGHEDSFRAAKAVAQLMPKGLDRIFFTNSGSEAIDTALKIAIAYHRARGDAQRTPSLVASAATTEWGLEAFLLAGFPTTEKTFKAYCCPTWNTSRIP